MRSCDWQTAHPQRLPDAVCVHAAGHILNELASEVHCQIACILHNFCKEHIPILAGRPMSPGYARSETASCSAHSLGVTQCRRWLKDLTQASEDIAAGIGQGFALFQGDIRCKFILQAQQMHKLPLSQDPCPFIKQVNTADGRHLSTSVLQAAAYHVLTDQLLELEHDAGARRQCCVSPLWISILCCLDGSVEFPLCRLWQA